MWLLLGLGVFLVSKTKLPPWMKADLPNFWYLSWPTKPVNLFNEIFKNLTPLSGGKSEGKVPFIELFDTSRYFNEWRNDTGFILPEILQLEMSRCRSLLRLANPDGKILKSLLETSRTISLENWESLTKFVNLLLERLRTWTDGKEPFLEVSSKPMVPPNLFLDRLTCVKLWVDQNQPGTEPLRELLERSIECNSDMFLKNFHDMMPLRFLEDKFNSLIGVEGLEQLRFVGLSQEMLKVETELKAFETSSWSLLLHVDCARTTNDNENRNGNLKKIFIIFFLYSMPSLKEMRTGFWFDTKESLLVLVFMERGFSEVGVDGFKFDERRGTTEVEWCVDGWFLNSDRRLHSIGSLICYRNYKI